MYSKITIILFFALALSVNTSVFAVTPEDQKLLNVDEIKKVRDLSRNILKSRSAIRKQMKQQLELDRAQLKEYQRELINLNRNKNVVLNDTTSPENEAWVEILPSSKNQSKVKRQQAKNRARTTRYKSISNRLSVLATSVDKSIPPNMKGTQALKLKGNESRRANKDKKILAVLRQVESEFRNADTSDQKHINQLNKIHKRFEIQSRAQKEGVNAKFPLAQPTNKLKLKYSVEEFEAMK